MASDGPEAPEMSAASVTSVVDAQAEDVQVSPCCQVWKNKYTKAEKGRICLKQAVRLLEKGCDNVQAQNQNLKKAYQEEQARAKAEKEGREKETYLRVSLENELSALKSEISNLKQKGVPNAEDITEELKLLKASLSDREKEISWLKELVDKEEKKVALEKKNAAAEKKEAEDSRTQLEALRIEVNETKSKLVSEKSQFDEVTKQLQEEKKKAVERAKMEMAKAAEERKIAEETKKKAVEERKCADMEMAKAKKLKKTAEETKKKAVEERKRSESEMAKAEDQQKLAEGIKKKAIEERRYAELEMAKVEEQRKMAEAAKKEVVEAKLHAENLFKQLEEDRRRNEELERKLHELSGSRNLGEGPFDKQDRIRSAEAATTNVSSPAKMLNEGAYKSKEVSKYLQSEELEKEKASSERKRANSDMRKAAKKRKLVEVGTKKVIEEKLHANNLLKQLEDARLKIDELQKQIHELPSSRKMVDGLVASSDKGISPEIAEVKLLKEQLKFEKKRVKHAKDVARLEKIRSNLLQQEVGHMKLELVQFVNRLDALDKCFSTPAEGIDNMEKDGDFPSMRWTKSKEKLHGLKFHKTCLQTENQFLTTRPMDTASNPLQETFRHSAHLLPVQGDNCTESITGINSELESLLGGSDPKILQTSAVNSSTASFSDRQLVGSQERGAFSVTTSAKLGEENLNVQPTILSMSDEVTRKRSCENLAVVAENSVRSPHPVHHLGRCNDRVGKRRKILDALGTIELMLIESKKLHLQLEDKLSVLHGMVKGQTDKTTREGKLVRSNLLEDMPYAVHNRSPKKRKTSHEETVAMKQSCEGMHMRQIQKPLEGADLSRATSQPTNNLMNSEKNSGENVCDFDRIDPKTVVGFEELINGNYMKLLDLDDAAEEERYRMAAEMPVSPLSEIEFPGNEAFEADQFRPRQDANNERSTHEDENVAPSNGFDVINVEKNSDKLQCNRPDTSPRLLQHENECTRGSLDIIRCNYNVSGRTMPTESACLSHPQIGGVEVERSVVPCSGVGVASIPFESEVISSVESIPEYCVVLSNIKDDCSVSKIIYATKSCISQCSLPAQTEFVMHRILHALKVEEKLSAKEKVCVFLSLVLLNFGKATLAKCSLVRDFIPYLKLFSEHANAVMSDAESRSLLAKLCLDELLSAIEDFLVEGKVFLYVNPSSETSVEYGSRIHVTIDGSDAIFSHEEASADLLVAASILLGSICAAADHTGFMCEAAYNIFRMHRYNSSVVLIILHVLASVGGDKFFNVRKYSLTTTVLKSIVMFHESKCAAVASAALSSVGGDQPQFLPCVGCPFSKDVLSVDTVVSLLFEKLQNFAQSGVMHPDQTAHLSNLNVMSTQGNTEQNLSWVLDMNCEVSCCLDEYNLPGKQSGSALSGTLCHISDILSLIELLACNMSWEWTCEKIIAQLLIMMESSVLESFTLAIIILLGQLGRLGVDAVGYEDKEVENLRVKLSSFLWRETTVRAGLPLQLATVAALLGLVSLDFEKVVQKNVNLPVISSRLVPADLIRNWFSLLTEEQRATSISLFQPVN